MHWTVSVTPEAEAELLAMPADIQTRFLHVAARHAHFPQLPFQRAHMRHSNPVRAECLQQLRDVQEAGLDVRRHLD